MAPVPVCSVSADVELVDPTVTVWTAMVDVPTFTALAVGPPAAMLTVVAFTEKRFAVVVVEAAFIAI
jgi:hypothetical protein